MIQLITFSLLETLEDDAETSIEETTLKGVPWQKSGNDTSAMRRGQSKL